MECYRFSFVDNIPLLLFKIDNIQLSIVDNFPNVLFPIDNIPIWIAKFEKKIDNMPGRWARSLRGANQLISHIFFTSEKIKIPPRPKDSD